MQRAFVLAASVFAWAGCSTPQGRTPPPFAPITVAKSGAFSGMSLDAMLSDASDCPDEALEPNDGPSAKPPFGPPIAIDVEVDMPGPRLQGLAICPNGVNPATGYHDSDYFEIDLKAPATIVAELTYDIRYGDLDLALVDGTGKVLASDGTAVSNACVMQALAAGTYYAVVVGANASDVNRYGLDVRALTMGAACPAASADMH